MRSIFARDAVIYFFYRTHRFHRISYNKMTQNQYGDFLRNAVNFAVNF